MFTDKKITFCAVDETMLDIWPHPQPASRFLPDEYKKLEKFAYGEEFRATVKACIPFLDSMTAGYIIPFDQDYIISPAGDEFDILPSSMNNDDVSFHKDYQLPKAWQSFMKGQKNAGKFMNKWLIKTPPGYSCLFVKPLNRFENRFEVLSGVVDTDVYINTINFPFILNKTDKSFRIKKGEAMIQVIPFKRESWKKWSGFYLEKLHVKTHNMIKSSWVDKYKKMFLNKKSYK